MPNFFVHETSIVDDKINIGENTKVWHFSHILSHTSIGANCSLGQNCVVGLRVNIGNGVKVQNNVSIHEGIEAEDDFASYELKENYLEVILCE